MIAAVIIPAALWRIAVKVIQMDARIAVQLTAVKAVPAQVNAAKSNFFKII